jgi:lauroyl/myristoyl acyltransferase
MPEMELRDSSIIKLRPCRFVQETADRFGIIRRAGMRRVVVRKSGLEACERFRGGCAIREAKVHLAGRYQIAEDTVDLRPLLRSLQNADLIAAVDGKPLPEACPPSVYSAYRYYLRFYVKQALLRLAYHKLPIALGKKLARWVHGLDLHALLWPKARLAEEHMHRSPQECLPASIRTGFAGRYFGHLIQNIVDFESLEAMTPLRAEKWLDRHVEYEGLEHLAQPKSESMPVIVAGFHFSATKLLALLLMRRGYDATQVWMPDGSVDIGSITKRLADFERDLPDYGKLSIIPDFSLPSYRRLLKSLRDGGTLVWFADMFGSKEQPQGTPATQEWAESAWKVFGFGQIRSELPQSKLAVTLCGQRVYLNPWIGGFARAAGAAVVPAALIRQRTGMRMILLPALRLPPNATAKHVEDLNHALFERLDALLRRHPEQWFGWHSLTPVQETTA